MSAIVSKKKLLYSLVFAPDVLLFVTLPCAAQEYPRSTSANTSMVFAEQGPADPAEPEAFRGDFQPPYTYSAPVTLHHLMNQEDRKMNGRH
jgi:hypothetical protein